MNVVYTRSEIRRSFRNPRYLIFTFGFPLVLFLVFQSTYGKGKLSGIAVAAYLMVSMATFGSLSAVFSTGGRIALERELNWNRQLRLTGLSGRAYVSGKALSGFAVAVPAMACVFLAAVLFQHVHLSAGRWLLVTVSILLALLPIAALGIWIGYVARGDSLQAISGGVYSLLSLFGGLWIPVTLFPHWLQVVCKALPVYWIAQSGRQALIGSWVGWGGLAVLAAWTVGLGMLATRAYLGTTDRS
jgi:ABC-2 type transport system permease protein